MTTLSAHVRPFRDEADREAMLALAREAAAQYAQQSYRQIGDIIWGMYQHPREVFDPTERIFLWEDAAGELLAFAWLDGPGSLSAQMQPRLRDDGSATRLLDMILAWAEERAAQAAGSPATLSVETLEDDTLYQEVLTRRGYRRGEATLLYFSRDLSAPIEAAALPEGWSIRHIADEDEYAQRVELHREVWRPSRVTVESYRVIRHAPIYRPELDLVAVAPDGTFAAYCTCWLDTQNLSGEFEPVGTRPAFRRLGLANAVLQEGCRRMQTLGARQATVYTGAQDAPPKFNAVAARRLYESAGFSVVNTLWTYHTEVLR